MFYGQFDMSSFFTASISQRKRKRENGSIESSTKRHPSKVPAHAKSQSIRATRAERDESISDSNSDENVLGRTSGEENNSNQGSSESGNEDETGAERRLRLAEQYLENIKGEVNEAGFDAEEIDRDLIAERLKEDVVCISLLLPLAYV